MKQKIFRRSRLTWRLTWTIGMFFLFLHQTTGLNFYWIYLYLFVVGSISLLFSMVPYIIFDDVKISFYYRKLIIFKKVTIDWAKIKTIAFKEITEKVHFTAGDFVRAPATLDTKKMAMSFIVDDNNISDELMTTSGKKLFPSDLIFSKKNSEILVTKAPDGGFSYLVDSLKKTVNSDVLNDLEIGPVRNKEKIIVIDFMIILAFFYSLTRSL